MAIIKRDEEPDLEELQRMLKRGTVVSEKPGITFSEEEIYQFSEEEIYQLAEILDVDISKIILSLTEVLRTGIPLIRSIDRSLLLKSVIEEAVQKNYTNYPAKDRAALVLYAEDIPYEDLPMFMPDNNDLVMAAIFKWRINLQK